MLLSYCFQASALPLSIIIVGIGGADFEGLCWPFSFLSDSYLFALCQLFLFFFIGVCFTCNYVSLTGSLKKFIIQSRCCFALFVYIQLHTEM